MKLSLLIAVAFGQATHFLKITISCDNQFVLYLPQQPAITGPNNYIDVKTYYTTVQGDGPWVVGIKGIDQGGYSGMFAGISIDGSPFTSTGFSTTKFKATLTPPASDWLTTNYNSSAWKTGAALATADCTNTIWNQNSGSTFDAKLVAHMPIQPIKASWLPGCSTVNNVVYFRAVVTAPTYTRNSDCLAAEKDRNAVWNQYKACRMANANYLNAASGCPAKYQTYNAGWGTWYSVCVGLNATVAQSYPKYSP